MEQLQRKHPRLKNYDYSRGGAYFITICTKNRAGILGTIRVGRDDLIPPVPALSGAGKIVERYICSMEAAYPMVRVPGYVVMPNHIHVMLTMEDGGMWSCRPTDGDGVHNPSVMMIVRALKRQVTMALGKPIWQASFYEHVIRDEASYLKHLQYMENNPARWAEDEYYTDKESNYGLL